MFRFCTIAIVLVASFSVGCTRMRFVVDVGPAVETLTETTVLRDATGMPIIGALTQPKVALIEVTGMILDAERPGFPTGGENPVARFSEALQRAERDGRVKALIIRINSPGGAVTATEVMHRELVGFKQRTGRPVIISMADVAASGGYYLATAGDEVIALPTTITGSIGVIIQTFNFSEGLRRIGIRSDSITSGPNKNMGTPFEPMTQEHRLLLQGLVDDFYASFKGIVIASRPSVAPQNIGLVTDGRVVTGARAAELGLIDRVGDLRDAFAIAKQRANITSARLVKYHRPMEHVAAPYSAAPGITPGAWGAAMQMNLLQVNFDAGLRDQSAFYYLWDPSISW